MRAQVSGGATPQSDTLVSSSVLTRSPLTSDEFEVDGLEARSPTSTDFSTSAFQENFARVPVSSGSMPLVQPKLVVGPANDKYEQEADRVADQVMRQERQGIQHEVKEELAHQQAEPVKAVAGLKSYDVSRDAQRLLRRGATQLESWRPTSAITERWRYASAKTVLSPSLRQHWLREINTDISAIPVHNDRFASRVAHAHGADGMAIDGAIYLSEDADDRVLGHELVHAVQQTNSGDLAYEPELEHEALQITAGEWHGVQLRAPRGTILLHPAYGTLRRAGRWLLRRSQRTISKHIARHGRQIAGRSVHTVFRIPRKIRSYVRRALDDAQALARSAARHGTDDVLTGPGIRVARQATGTPGKFRVIVDREFRSAIGTQGERILRVVIDQSGRLVTAFPVDRLLTLGLTSTAAITAFSASTAEAAESIHAAIESGTREPERDWITWLIDFLVAPSVANEGEQLWLFVRDTIAETTQRVIAEIEETEQMSLGPEQREAIEDLVAAAIGAPMLLEDESMWDDTEE